MKKSNLAQVYTRIKELSADIQFRAFGTQELPRVRKALSDAHAHLVSVGLHVQSAIDEERECLKK